MSTVAGGTSTRRPRACVRCHDAKQRCKRTKSPSKCDRCLKLNRECVLHISMQGNDRTGPITLGRGRALRTNASSRRWCKSASSCGWCKSADLNISVDCLFHWFGPFFNAANEFVSCFKCSCSSCQVAQNVNTGNPNMAASVGNTSNQLG